MLGSAESAAGIREGMGRQNSYFTPAVVGVVAIVVVVVGAAVVVAVVAAVDAVAAHTSGHHGGKSFTLQLPLQKWLEC